MASQQTTRDKSADDWVRDEVHAVLRGEDAKGYDYHAIHDLSDAIAIFTMRQRAYATSISSGVRRLDQLTRPPREEGNVWAPTRTATVGKRLFDIVFSAVALVMLAPLLAVIAIAVKLSSPGPVFFRQMRVGRDNRIFLITKFRTMVRGVEELGAARLHRSEATEGLFKLAEDPRVTSVGRVLRRTSLDGLPQLLNVLRGDMSLVGPCPLIVEVAHSSSDRERHPSTTLRPGMTGVGRLRHDSLEHQIALEDDYATGNWSVVRDLGVLMRALVRLLRSSY